MTLEIKPIAEYPGYFIYSDGRVFSTISHKFLTPGLTGRDDDSGKYSVVGLKDFNGILKTVRVHRLVAQAFIPNPHGYCVVNHKDGNKQNNDVSNLEWCTYSYNNKHAYDTGLKFGKRKLRDLSEIFEDYISLEYSRKDLEKKYNWFTSRGFNGYLTEYAKKVGRLDEFLEAKAQLKSCSNSRAKKKPVTQLTLDNQIIAQWDSATDAEYDLKIPKAGISKCCKHQLKSCHGYHWEFTENLNKENS